MTLLLSENSEVMNNRSSTNLCKPLRQDNSVISLAVPGVSQHYAGGEHATSTLQSLTSSVKLLRNGLLYQTDVRLFRYLWEYAQKLILFIMLYGKVLCLRVRYHCNEKMIGGLDNVALALNYAVFNLKMVKVIDRVDNIAT